MSKLESRWELEWDGFYVYCENCEYQVDRDEVIKDGKLPEFCPKCGAKMINHIDFSKKEGN